ncbi:MAG: aspartate/glutamate racemase family protein [Candidatus Dormibacteraceae bacterium]
MRLLYQSFGQSEGMEGYRAALETLLAASVADAEVSLGALPSALLDGKGYASAHALDVPLLLDSIALKVDDGVDGVAIGNAFDPGLWEARELFEVPILGWFETLILYALRVGWRVGVLCSGLNGPARVEEMALRYGVAGRMVRPRSIGITLREMLPAFEDRDQATGVVEAAQRTCALLAEDGAETVIVASGMLDVLLETAGFTSLAGLPVLPGIPVLMHELEAAVALHRYGVPSVSRVARFRTPPPTVRAALHRARRD